MEQKHRIYFLHLCFYNPFSRLHVDDFHDLDISLNRMSLIYNTWGNNHFLGEEKAKALGF